MMESELWERVRQSQEVFLPLALEVMELKPRFGQIRPDALLRVSWGGHAFEFVADAKTLSTPKSFEMAVDGARRYAEATSRLPFVVLPYLRPSQVQQLADVSVSGMDLSGNGVLAVENTAFFYRTGLPERYRETGKLYNVYQGASSLVGRVLLARPLFPSVNAVLEDIARKGGTSTQPTVSKAIRQMDEDLMISRSDRVLPSE